MKNRILLGIHETRFNKDMVKERRALKKALEQEGLEIKVVDQNWPRDFFVSHNGEVLTRKKYGNYAEGGYILNGDSFIIASIHVGYSLETGRNTLREEIGRKFQKLYKESEVFLIGSNPNYVSSKYRYGHIDREILLIPQRKLLVFAGEEERLFKYNCYAELRRFVKSHDFEVKNIPEKEEAVCNSLLIEKDKRLILFAPYSDSFDFGVVLKGHNIDIRFVEFGYNWAGGDDCLSLGVGGGIRCVTNTIPEDYKGSLNELFSWKLEVEE